MRVNAGNLNKKIQIIGILSDRDEDGYETRREVIVREPWAQFSQIRGTELMKSGASFSEVKVRFLIRWSGTPVSRKMVVRYNGADYDIEYINGYGDSMEYMELWCSRRTLEG